MYKLVVITPEPTQEYVSLVSHIANLWEDACNNAITAVNESLMKITSLTISNPMTQRYGTYKEIECIKEYKQRLIRDVVTGQIKVC